jgi:L-ascorbate metabolism protein UlaG (beta-lactamase superfamily)
MILEYLAHACFLFTTQNLRILIDPYTEKTGYKLPMRSADFVLISDIHEDHNNLSGVKGKSIVIKGAGKHKAGDVEVKGILADHDSCAGKLYGNIVIYKFIMDGLKFCHLSDLGCKLNPLQIKEIGEVDVLFLPVGGTFTLNGIAAKEVMEQLKPKVTIPMHYLTATLNRSLYPLENREKFLEGCKKVKIIRDSVLELTPETLPQENQVWALNSTF